MQQLAANYATNQVVNYYTMGSGPVVVFLHGFAEDSTIWTPQINVLSANYRCLLINLPGTGGSTLAGKAFTIAELATAVNVVLVQEQIEQCVLIGHSMGGYTALAFAQAFAQKLVGLGLFSSSSFADDADKKISRQKNIDFLLSHGTTKFLQTAIPGLFANPALHHKLITQLIKNASVMPAATLAAYQAAMAQRPDTTSVLKEATYPILFIAGRQDKAVLPGHTAQQAGFTTFADYHVLQNSGHMGMVEETEKSNLILKNFLSLAYSS